MSLLRYVPLLAIMIAGGLEQGEGGCSSGLAPFVPLNNGTLLV